MTTLGIFVLFILANARSERLLSEDDVFIPFWTWAEKKFHLKRLMQLSWCHWCSGVWTALLLYAPGALALLTWLHQWPLWLPFAMWIPTALAISYASARLVDSEGRTSGPAA